MSKVSQLSSSLTLATASTSLFLFPSPSQPLSHHSCSASICLSCLSIYLSSHSFNKYSLNSGSVSGTMPSVKDEKKKERKKGTVFPSKSLYFTATMLVHASVTSGLDYDHTLVFLPSVFPYLLNILCLKSPICFYLATPLTLVILMAAPYNF